MGFRLMSDTTGEFATPSTPRFSASGHFWARWWSGLAGFVLLVIFARTLLPVWLGTVVIILATIGWIAVVEFTHRELRGGLPQRFSFIWGRLTPLGLAGAMLLSTLSGLIGIWLSNVSQVGFILADLLIVVTVLWFLIGGEVVIALWIARVAESKGRSFTAWFWLGFLFPVISWIIVATMAPNPHGRCRTRFQQ